MRLGPLASLLVAAILASCGLGGGGSGPSPSPAPTPSPAPIPVPPAEPASFCLGSHSLEDDAIALLLDLLGDGGETRYTLYVNLHESDPAYRAHFPTRIRAATEAGLEVHVVAHNVPGGWTADRFARWIGQRAAEMPEVRSWQIGNEAWSIPGGLPVGEYNHWLNLSYAAIKQADPDALVVSAALPSIDFARALTAPADAVAVHAYGRPLDERVRELSAWTARRPLWITEFGIERRVIGDHPDWEAAQLDEVRRAYLATGEYDLACAYQLRTDEPGETHGWIRPDGTPRPVYEWFKEYLANP